MFNFFGSDGSVIQSDRVCKFKHCDATRALTILESGKAGHLASQQAGSSGKNPAKRFDWLTDASAKTTPPSVSHAFPRPLTDGAVGTRRNGCRSALCSGECVGRVEGRLDNNGGFLIYWYLDLDEPKKIMSSHVNRHVNRHSQDHIPASTQIANGILTIYNN